MGQQLTRQAPYPTCCLLSHSRLLSFFFFPLFWGRIGGVLYLRFGHTQICSEIFPVLRDCYWQGSQEYMSAWNQIQIGWVCKVPYLLCLLSLRSCGLRPCYFFKSQAREPRVFYYLASSRALYTCKSEFPYSQVLILKVKFWILVEKVLFFLTLCFGVLKVDLVCILKSLSQMTFFVVRMKS